MAPKENAQPAETELSARHAAIFAYPPKLASARAEVLARMLEGEAITAADTYHGSSTMRAAAHVHALRSIYGWPILSEEEEAICNDGHVARIARYRLTPETIMRARSAGAGDWCAQVRQARAAKRKAHTAQRGSACVH